MELKFSVSAHISRPIEEVFEAIADPKKLSGYFTTGGAQGRLETGKTVMWDFHDFPGAFPVDVIEVSAPSRIVLQWDANEGPADDCGPTPSAGYKTTVTMQLVPLDEGRRTLVTITEEGWRQTPGGLQASYGNCMGWSQMLCALKAYVEHGINLRDGMYR
jgi:uncharacterized protein YndB with AHSA1/START domain